MTSDEQAFMNAIAAHPGDDTARLVYADWLDDHDQAEKAAFVRAAVRIRQDTATVAAGMNKLPPGWLGQIMGSYAVILSSWPSNRKVQVVKAIRDATGWGLGESVYAAENLPRKIALTTCKLEGHPFTFRVLMPRRNSGPDESLQRPLLCDEANQLAVTLRAIGCEVVLTPFVVASIPRAENPADPPLISYDHAICH
jgi:uncharacterized protein (TIGR02996 family)